MRRRLKRVRSMADTLELFEIKFGVLEINKTKTKIQYRNRRLQIHLNQCDRPEIG
jgi:hypothetical protein